MVLHMRDDTEQVVDSLSKKRMIVAVGVAGKRASVVHDLVCRERRRPLSFQIHPKHGTSVFQCLLDDFSELSFGVPQASQALGGGPNQGAPIPFLGMQIGNLQRLLMRLIVQNALHIPVGYVIGFLSQFQLRPSSAFHGAPQNGPNAGSNPIAECMKALLTFLEFAFGIIGPMLQQRFFECLASIRPRMAVAPDRELGSAQPRIIFFNDGCWKPEAKLSRCSFMK